MQKKRKFVPLEGIPRMSKEEFEAKFTEFFGDADFPEITTDKFGNTTIKTKNSLLMTGPLGTEMLNKSLQDEINKLKSK